MTFSNVVGTDDKNYLMIENENFVEYCMSKLTKNEQQFVNYRYYEEKTQKEISEIMNMSQMQVSRLEKKILKKLRNLYFRD